jgi:hypothetical protein
LLSLSIPPNSPAKIYIQPISDFPGDKDKEGYIFGKSYVLDYDRKNLNKRHVIIPFDQLIKFIDSNFVCKLLCKGSKSTYQRQTRGIATSLNWWFCCCGAGGLIKASIHNKDEAEKKEWN